MSKQIDTSDLGSLSDADLQYLVERGNPALTERLEAELKGREFDDKSDGPFNPDDHTVDEVVSFLSEHPDQADAVLAAERDGQARKGILGDE